MSIFQYRALNEIYFGKTKDIIELQHLISQLRKDMKENDKSIKRVGNISEFVFKINRKVEDIFGFEIYSLNMIYSPEVNAFTMPIGMKFDVWNEKKNFIPNKNSLRYDKSAGYCCNTYIYSGLFMDEKYSDEELLAIILHEIGHNFQTSLNPNSFIFNTIKKSMYFISLIMIAISRMNPLALTQALNNTNAFTKIGNKIDQFIYNKFKGVISFSDFISDIINKYNYIFTRVMILLNPMMYVISIIRTILQTYNPISLAFKMMGYNDEKIADDVATIYGYGPELSSALMKMSYIPKGDSKLIQSINEMLTLPIMILVTPADEHPATLVRCKEMIDYLSTELLENTTDPKMKKKIKQEIDDIKKEMDKLLNYKYDSTDIKNVHKVYDVFMYQKFGGGLKDALLKVNNNEIIHKSYQNAFDKVKIK